MSKRGNRRLNAKRDDNEPDIIRALEAAGVLVEALNGTGTPDLLIGTPDGRLMLFEVKAPRTGRLTDVQTRWHRKWQRTRPRIVTRPRQAALLAAIPPGGLRRATALDTRRRLYWQMRRGLRPRPRWLEAVHWATSAQARYARLWKEAA